jgi:hypothetical protein
VWWEKYELELALNKIDYAIISPCPIILEEPVRRENESDADFVA